MSDINFTAKNLNLIGYDGYATIDSDNTIEINSKNYLNLNADTVGISTDITIGGQVASDLIIAEGFYVGIGTTNPTSALTVIGTVEATSFSGSLTGTATSTTNIPNLTGDITSTGTATAIATGVIVNADINASAGIVDTKLATIATALKVSNSATTATNANTASAIVARDGSGNFSAGTITANLTGTASNVTTNANLTGHVTSVGNAAVLGSFTSAQLATALLDETGSGANVFANSPILVTPLLGTPTSGNLANCTFPTLNQSTTGNAATVTTNANLTGDITSVGNATAIATGVIVNADINASAGIVDTKLATIATAGKVSNGATTATSANTASAIVARDASGNFSAGTITATTFSGSGSGLTGLPASSISWSISASGSTDYVFSGPGIVAGNTNDPVLYLYKGFTYTFINTTGGSHPFAIRVSNGGASYTPGVSGSTTGTQTFVVPMNAPSTLYYQCTIHGGMGNTINIV